MSDDADREDRGAGRDDRGREPGGEELDASWWQTDDDDARSAESARGTLAGAAGGRGRARGDQEVEGDVAGDDGEDDADGRAGPASSRDGRDGRGGVSGRAGASTSRAVTGAGAAGAAAAGVAATARAGAGAGATAGAVGRAMTGGAGAAEEALAGGGSSELPRLTWPAARPPQRRRWPLALGLGSAVAIAVAIIAGVNSGSKSNKAVTTTAATPTSASAAPKVTEAPTTAPAPTTTPAASPATTTAPTTAAAPTTTVARPTTTAAPPTTATVAPAPTTTAAAAPATTAAPAPAAVARDPNSPPDPAAVAVLKPTRWAVLSGGKVYLRGRVPSQAVADELHAKVAAGVGEGNLFVEYTIDPSAPLPPSSPIFVADTVLFEPDSAVVRPEFQNTLNLGRSTMQVNPTVTVTVIGRADARGSAEYNLDLSRRRARAVIDYLARDDIDRSRFTEVAKGFEDPIADQSTDAGMAANRAVEFVVSGFLD